MPTVVRRSPKPIRTAIGDLSDSRRLLARFDLEQQNYIKEESPMRKKLAKTDTTAAFERAVKAASPKEKYILRLYVAGINPKSSTAIRSVTAICEEHLKGRYELEIVDIYQQPTLAKGEQIVAAPTLIKQLPLPLRRLIGDMASKDRILVGLDLRPKK